LPPRATCDEGDRHVFLLVARPPAKSRHDASLALGVTHWPRLLDGVEDLGFALLRDGFPMRFAARPPTPSRMQADELPYDVVLQIRAGGYPGLASFARDLEAEGYRVAAVATRRFGTSL
jgi:hypothetical protein